MIEAGTIFAATLYLALMLLAARLLTRPPDPVPVAARIPDQRRQVLSSQTKRK